MFSASNLPSVSDQPVKVDVACHSRTQGCVKCQKLLCEYASIWIWMELGEEGGKQLLLAFRPRLELGLPSVVKVLAERSQWHKILE